ncbi:MULTISPECIES: class I SAM-dependent methyltransferase [Cellulophaga]|uniref:Methyltransferase type 11 n=1 Tax=Cellulophaga lytica (strain ATCC 23178 / DSM 7489 / JCM 8516 / NBRC 14961 / NCIMB 1423 / VKM B-1433 / Cy l20) TaxID=867900 RepID=F0RFP4_CELLC|nr:MULTISPECIES: class I SAM-dependent methyltransferase [Cellulophaga]ADY30019.1 Methyltransferase type 11 [Cellulophaga lytica DSM 7489]AIM61012.1 methyltransferase [Cellulophaga lytica]TVZ10654.1 methyltransferase family protein [Cellulophaga sp. RHA_52]WQG75818.1 class I SAM-dependent methyltransferase [Cellulophaga lytica]
MGSDIFGAAMLDYLNNTYKEDIVTRSSISEDDTIPVPYLFRSYAEMPIIEQKALNLSKGKVLDIGCGAGSHSLYLQNKNIDVTALDSSKGAIEACKKRGISKTINAKILEHNSTTYDTLLLLMNGIGIVGELNKLGDYLQHLKSLLNTNGQLLLDSSDIIYMFEEDEDGGYWIPPGKDYYGEVDYEMQYKNEKSDTFPWLYLDYNTLQRAAILNGFNCELIVEGEHYDYLAKLTVAKQ